MTQKYLEPLLSRPDHSNSSVLSVYLNVDESDPVNLNRGFEKNLTDRLATIRKGLATPTDIELFNAAAGRILDFVAAFEVHARTLVMFYDVADGFFWHDAYGVALPTQVHWNSELFLQPLMGLLDEFENYGIVLVDRANMRIVKMFLGSVEEIARDKFSRKAVQHVRSVGLDQAWSATLAQQKADEHVRMNLKRVVKRLNTVAHEERFDHLILAGPPEVTAALKDMLPKRLALLVVDSMGIRFNSTLDEIRRAALPIAEHFERKTEMVAVSEVTNAAAKGERAVVGLRDTLHALNHFRVWQLIYTAGFRTPGFECRNCHALTSVRRLTCMYCSSDVDAVPDVIERAVEHALRRGGRIEIVKGQAADAFTAAGSIGAILRARAVRLRA
jgi:peptide chain release factor subunit 1